MAVRRGLKTTDHPDGARWSCRRAHSRILRLRRLRRTAFPNARGTVNPILGRPASSRLKQKAANSGPEIRSPFSYTCRNSLVRSNRQSFGKVKPECVVPTR